MPVLPFPELHAGKNICVLTLHAIYHNIYDLLIARGRTPAVEYAVRLLQRPTYSGDDVKCLINAPYLSKKIKK